MGHLRNAIGIKTSSQSILNPPRYVITKEETNQSSLLIVLSVPFKPTTTQKRSVSSTFSPFLPSLLVFYLLPSPSLLVSQKPNQLGQSQSHSPQLSKTAQEKGSGDHDGHEGQADGEEGFTARERSRIVGGEETGFESTGERAEGAGEGGGHC